MSFIILDTETTDREPNNRLVQLAYKNLSTGEIVNEYFKPATPITIGAMAIHHITNKMVEDKPLFEGSIHKTNLVELLKNNILVAHNAPFDIGVLKLEGVETGESIDTLRIARHLLDAEQYSLQFLRYLLDLNVTANPHDALGDILVLEALFNYLQKHVKEKFNYSADEEVLNKLIELTNQPVLMEVINFGKYKGKTFEEVASIDKSYLQWLFGSETQKPETEQNVELVYTLKHWL